MDTLKKIFPLAFKAKKDIGALIINILLHIVADIVAGLIIGLLSGLPLIGWAFRSCRRSSRSVLHSKRCPLYP